MAGSSWCRSGREPLFQRTAPADQHLYVALQRACQSVALRLHGRFHALLHGLTFAAYRRGVSIRNENSELVLETAHGRILVRQVLQVTLSMHPGHRVIEAYQARLHGNIGRAAVSLADRNRKDSGQLGTVAVLGVPLFGVACQAVEPQFNFKMPRQSDPIL